MKTNALRIIALLMPIILSVAACGGGTGGTGIASGTNVVSTGVMTKGSVILNGVRFEDNTASILIDDMPKTAAALQNGMVVKVRGTFNAESNTGTAQQIKALVEVRGTPTSVNPAANPQSLVVLGQTVLVDDQTVYSNLAGFGVITTSTLIEVHGLRDTAGRILATRIEANPAQMGDNTVDEIRGVVSNGVGMNPTAFSLGPQLVSVVGGAVIAPAGASYQNGSLVEVHCTARPCVVGGVFQASRIEVEDAEDPVLRPASGQRVEIEGLISGFNGHPGDFSVADIPVTTTGSTQFQGGISTDLRNNIKIEAEGTWNGSRLVANRIEFKRSVVRLQGSVTAAGATTFTLNIAGRVVNIETDSLTDGTVPPVGPNCVQVRGQRKIGAPTLTVTAVRIESGCSNGDRPVIQAPVEAENPETTITLLGFVIDVSNPTDVRPYEGVNDQPLTKTEFFNAVTPAGTDETGISRPGTLVKVIFNDGTNTVRQAELED